MKNLLSMITGIISVDPVYISGFEKATGIAMHEMFS